MREFSSKATEHACRIAGVLTLIGDPMAACVGDDTMQAALELAQYYIREHVRLAGTAAISGDIANADKLLTWIRRKGLRELTLRDVMQRGPYAIREAPVAKAALCRLCEYGWLQNSGHQFTVVPYQPAEEAVA